MNIQKAHTNRSRSFDVQASFFRQWVYLFQVEGGNWMRLVLRLLYSILLFGAGVLHFVHEERFRKIVPKALPFRRAIVLITGVFEMLFAVLLWVKKGHQITSKLLVSFMVAVFPANIYMALKKISFQEGKKANPWILWLRLPLQIPLIIGALTLGRKDADSEQGWRKYNS